MSTDIKELQELIEREKTAGERIRKARDEAQTILKTAHQEAESILNGAESGSKIEEFREKRELDLSKKRAEIEAEYKRKLSDLERAARENFDKAIAYVVEEASRVES